MATILWEVPGRHFGNDSEAGLTVSFADIADRILCHNRRVFTQFNMVDTAASFKGKSFGDDCTARRDGPLKGQSKLRLGPAAWPDDLIEVAHHCHAATW